MKKNTTRWYELVKAKNPELLSEILADDVVFHSPIVHAPQRGKKLTQLYLSAAIQVFLSGNFVYIREVEEGNHSFLEFEVEIEGILINGVDMITWNEDGQISDFKVMIRPFKAITLIHQKMGEILMKYQRNS